MKRFLSVLFVIVAIEAMALFVAFVIAYIAIRSGSL